MGASLQTRAASLGASSLLIGLAVISALTLRYVAPVWRIPEPQVIESVTEPTPAAQPLEPRPRVQPPRAPTQASAAVPPIAAPPLEVSTGPAQISEPFAPGPALITNPHWVRRPSDLARYYPRRAATMNVEGMAMLDCVVRTSGALDCAVVSETPEGWGFGAAALRIAGEHRMTPASRDGEPVEARYRMRVPFDLQPTR